MSVTGPGGMSAVQSTIVLNARIYQIQLKPFSLIAVRATGATIGMKLLEFVCAIPIPLPCSNSKTSASSALKWPAQLAKLPQIHQKAASASVAFIGTLELINANATLPKAQFYLKEYVSTARSPN